jgi:hypothetical protein
MLIVYGPAEASRSCLGPLPAGLQAGCAALRAWPTLPPVTHEKKRMRFSNASSQQPDASRAF